MHASVRAAVAASVALTAILASAAQSADKSTKPRLAVLEFSNRAAGPDIASARWGTWIADVERPGAAGGFAKADGLDISWDVPEAEASRVSKVDAISIKQKAMEEGAAPRANDRLRNAGPRNDWPTAAMGNTKRKNIVLKRGVSAAAAPGGVRVAVGDVDGSSDPASGQATGKRVHKPIRIRTYDAPLPRGSLLIELAQPWPACAEGDRFNGAYMTIGATHRYRLDGATIVGCAANAVAINYANAVSVGR